MKKKKTKSTKGPQCQLFHKKVACLLVLPPHLPISYFIERLNEAALCFRHSPYN